MDRVPIIFDLVANCESIMDCSLKSDLLEAIDQRDSEKENNCDIEENKTEITKKDIEDFFIYDQVIDAVNAFRSIEGRLEGNFEQNISDIIKYFDGHGYLPKMNSTDKHTRRLAGFLIKERIKRRDAESKNVDYPAYRVNKLESIPGFSWNPRKEKFNIFLYYLKEYKKNKNIDAIENNEVFKNYPIGKQYSNYCYKYKHNLLDDVDRKKFENLVGEVKNRYEIRYKNNYLIAQECIKQGILITKKNPCFKNVNLYEWIYGTLKSKYDNNRITSEEKRIIKQLIGFGVEEIGKRGKRPIPIKVICNNEEMKVETYSTITEAAKSLSDKLNITISPCVVGRCLRGIRKNELYGFRFEYVDTTN